MLSSPNVLEQTHSLSLGSETEESPLYCKIVISLQPHLRKQDVHSQVISGLLTILRDKQLCEGGNSQAGTTQV